MMKRVLIVTNLFYPDRGGGGAVFSDLAFGLAERGHEVTVFTTFPYYPEWEKKSTANPWRRQVEEIKGVQVVRHGLRIPTDASSLWQRILFEGSFAVSLLRSLFRGKKNDIVIAYCPIFGSLTFGILRKWLRREKLWINIQDIPGDAAASTGFGGGSLFYGFVNSVQRFLFRQAQILSTISPVMVERVKQISGKKDSVHYLPNWLNESVAVHIPNARAAASPRTDKLRLLYAGNIGNKQGMRQFCELLQGYHADFSFRVFGDGSQAAEVKKYIDGLNDDRFFHGPFLDEDEFLRELADADYFLITEKSGIQASFIPCKMIPCISVGTPILAICDAESPLGTEVRDYGLGAIVDWDELDGLPERFTELREQRAEFAANCQDRATFYSRNTNISRVLELAGLL